MCVKSKKTLLEKICYGMGCWFLRIVLFVVAGAASFPDILWAESVSIGRVEIQVVHREHGNPVPGAELVFRILPAEGDAFTESVMTGDDGIGGLNLANRRVREIDCRVTRSGFMSVATHWDLAHYSRSFADPEPVIRSQVQLMPRTRRISGTVVDAQMRGIPGVTVLLDYYHRGTSDQRKREVGFRGFTEAVQAITDEDGRWEMVAWVSRRDRSPRLRFQHPEFPDHGDPSESEDPLRRDHPWWSWDPRGNFRSWDLAELLTRGDAVTVMSGGFTCSGQVNDADGQPVAGADVALLAPFVGRGGRMTQSWSNGILKLQSDDAGRFEIRDRVVRFVLMDRESAEIALADYEVSLVVGQAGLQLAHQAFPYFQTGVHKAVFQLKPGPLFEGQVVDVAGNPVPEVSVRLESWRQPSGAVFGAQAFSGDDGRFAWPYPLDGWYTVHFGWMVDKAGSFVRRSRLTDFRGIEARDAEYEVELPESSSRVFRLGEPVKLSGTVTHSETAAPLAEFLVRVVDEADSDVESDIELGRALGRDGSYVVEIPQGYDHQTLSVLISADGFLTARAGPNNLPNIPNPLVVELWPFDPIEGSVSDAEGQPVSGATVQRIVREERDRNQPVVLPVIAEADAEPRGLLNMDHRHAFPFRRAYTRTRTGTDGKFVIGDQPIQYDERPEWAKPSPFEGLPDAIRRSMEAKPKAEKKEYLLVLAAEGFACVPVAEMDDRGHIQLQALSEVTVRLPESGEPAAFRRVQLSHIGNPEDVALQVSFPGRTNADGEARFEGLIPGRYEVAVALKSGSGMLDRRGEVVAEAGQSRTLEIGGAGYAVLGRLVADPGVPAIDWSTGRLKFSDSENRIPHSIQSGLYLVSGNSGGDADTPSSKAGESRRQPRAIWPDAEGRFSVAGVPPGRYRLRYVVTDDLPGPAQHPFGVIGKPNKLNRIFGGMIEMREAVLPMLGVGRSVRGLLNRGVLLGYAEEEFVVPAESGGNAVELGDLALHWAKHPAVGEPAPLFAGAVDEGETLFHSQSLVGQRVVLAFGNGGPASDRATQVLGNALHQELEEAVRPVLISPLLVDSKRGFRFPRAPRGANRHWREVYVGQWEQSEVAEAFGIFCIPYFFVIGPGGLVELETPSAEAVYRWLVQGDENEPQR